MTSWMGWMPTIVTVMPLIGVLILLFLPRDKAGWHRGVGIAATLPSLAFSLLLYAKFDPALKGMQWLKSIPWFRIPFPQGGAWFFHFSMGVDGLSLPLVLLTCVVSTLAVIASLYIKTCTKEYYIWMLVLETGMIGVFLAANFFLFFIFFEVTLIATFFLIGGWGYLGKEKAANHFLLYNGLGSGFMLFAMIGFLMFFGSLDYSVLQERIGQLMEQLALLTPQAKAMLWLTFISLIIAFGIKLPMFPFHTWMLRVHVEAPTPVVMIHSGILLKMGAYGLIRFGVGFFPGFMKTAAFLLSVLGLVNILYGAVLAIVERELKKVLAYSSISHMGVILFGLASLNEEGLTGAVFQAVSHGLISALFFFLVGSLYERTKTTQLDDLGGLAKSMPLLSGMLMVAGLALLGLPGFSGFISEFFAFLGLFQTKPFIAAVGTLGLILATVYALRAVLKTTFGPVQERFLGLTDIRAVESVSMFVLVGLITLIGIAPAVLGGPMHVTLQLLISKIGG